MSNSTRSITCPACNYTGHGFRYAESPRVYSPVEHHGESGLLVRLDLSEIRFDAADDDRLQCPECGALCPLPENLGITVTRRKIAASDAEPAEA